MNFLSAYHAVDDQFRLLFLIKIPIAVARFRQNTIVVMWISNDAAGNRMIFSVMIWVHVGTAILFHLSLFKLVGVVSRWINDLGVTIDADRGLDVLR